MARCAGLCITGLALLFVWFVMVCNVVSGLRVSGFLGLIWLVHKETSHPPRASAGIELAKGAGKEMGTTAFG